jgi:glutamate-ammonia-ligase adenylyltransferase
VADTGIDRVLGALLPADEAARLVEHVRRLPDPDSALRALARVREDSGRPLEPSRILNFITLAGFSPYLASLLVQNPEFLDALPASGGPRASPTRADLDEELARFVHLNAAQDPSLVLRRFKKRELLRIVLADILRQFDLPAVTRALSLLADVLVDKAVRIARLGLENRFGRPACRDDQGHPEEATFAVVALGKLGGEELNYSSDIDLLYLFSRDGETGGIDTSGRGSISNKEFFSRLATDVTRLVSGGGPEGQVFRVDLGLRPGGADGEMVIPLAAAAAYYRNWAETWERQALIKARPAAGDLLLGRRFVESVEPLVYASVPDPYVILEIGEMKDRIDARLGSKGRSESDIKLGRGGIRELEFGVQALQLQHGGRDLWLRQGNTLLALHRLADKGFVHDEEHASLSKAYVFLRDLEHRLQLGENRQTASLPSSPREIGLVARRMRLHEAAPGREVETLLGILEAHREAVRRFYDSVTGQAAQVRLDEESADPWLDRLDDESLMDLLRRSGIDDPITVLKPVRLIRKHLQAAAAAIEIRRAMRRSGPQLLTSVVRSVNPRRALQNLERLLSSLAEQDGGLLRFLSRRDILAPTVRLLGRSDLLAGILIRQPGILDALEDRRRIVRAPGREEYLRLFRPVLRLPGDGRARAADLRRRHQEALATIAIRDINRQATLREVLKSLSDLAEAILDTTFSLARQELARGRRGGPRGLRVAVLGLGRLGYREMDYGSDLDLVFLLDAPEDRPDLRRAARVWCEGVVRILSTLSRDGQLYSVDLRLRPSGGEGELVASLEGIVDYLHGAADVWEKLAFLKARPVAGDPVVGARAGETVESALLESVRGRGPGTLAADVEAMRRRLAELAEDGATPSVKLSEGGFYDLDFIIELLQLRHGVRSPSDKDTLRLLTHLHRLGHLNDRQLQVLYEAYLFFRALDHEMRLIWQRPLKSLPDDPMRLAELALAFEGDPEAGRPERARSLQDAFRRHAAAVRSVYEEIVR